MCICFSDSAKRVAAAAALESPYVATYMGSIYDNAKFRKLKWGDKGRDFADNNGNVSDHLRTLITKSIGWKMNVELVWRGGWGIPEANMSDGAYVLDRLQKYSKPNGRGCGAWFDYTVNNVGHVFRSALNFITGGFFSSSLNSEWTDTEEAIVTKFTAAVLEAIRTDGMPKYSWDERDLRVQARCCARKILAECLEEYANPSQRGEYVALNENSEKAFVDNMLARYKRPG